MKISIVLLFVFLSVHVLFAQRGPGYKNVSAREFNVLINDNINEIIIDSRGEKAYKYVRIVGAINIAKMSKLKSFCDTIDKDTPLLVYCDMGTRSTYVCKYLADLNFKKVYSLKGGIINWQKHEYPTESN